MDLAPHSRLGPYEVLAPLGAGGMGEVYKARDTRLNRVLALKILPASASSNPDRQRRFLREAKAASALNHPNIAHIYDIGEEGGTPFIAMEYVSGVTLGTKINARGLAIEELLTYAVEIADALAKAHEAGIVHRDVKPANIMITDAGSAKILDFGIAKLREPVDFDRATQTATRGATHDDQAVGTVAYMAPEQAEGKPVDGRSDIFSFGVVLYEMATGRQPFVGDSAAAVLVAILHDEPSPISTSVTGPHSELERIVLRCLRKDPARRFQHMDDVRVALIELKEAAAVAPSAGRARNKARLPIIRRSMLAAVVLALLGFVAHQFWPGTRAAVGPEVKLTRLTSDSGLTTDPALSADGSLLAFASDRGESSGLDIWVQQVPSGNPLRRTSFDTDESEPTFSPDNAQIAFRSEQSGGGIYVVGALGGDEPRLLAPGGYTPRYSPDGKWLAYWTGVSLTVVSGGIPGKLGQIFVVSSSGGTPRAICPEFSIARYPTWSPDSRHLLFVGERDPTKNGADVDWWVVAINGEGPVASGANALLVQQGFEVPVIPGTWGTDGVLFSAKSGDSTNLWRLPLSAATGLVSGVPERLTSGSGLEVHPNGTLNGRVVFAGLNDNVGIWSIPLDADRGKVAGPMEPLTRNAAPEVFTSLSAQGDRLTFSSVRSGKPGLWIMDAATRRETPLPQAGDSRMAAISRDGKSVAYDVAHDGGSIEVIEGVDGVPRTACTGCIFASSWLADGRSLLVGAGTPTRLDMVDVVTGRRREIARHPTYDIFRPDTTADSRWVAFHTTNNPNVRQIFVLALDDNRSIPFNEWIAITPAAKRNVMASWSPNGALVYFASDRDGFWCVWAQPVDGATKRPVGDPFPVSHQHSARLSIGDIPGGPKNRVAPGRMVLSARERTGNIWMREVVEHPDR